MWSGPRNLSTALMYAFAARGDCAVWDEPFYAAYLRATGIDHPMRDAIIAAHDPDPASVAAACTGPIPQGQSLFYQKHMTLHMIPAFDRGFMRQLTNVFLIRHPARVVASYSKKREAPTLADIGFVQQAELFDQVAGWLRAVSHRGYATAYRAFAEGDTVYADRLDQIRCPLLVLTGDGDANSTPAMTETMAEMAPHGRAAIISGHRHMVNLTAPEAVTAELQRWLSTKETAE